MIHNYSDFTLSKHMISVLNGDPGFVPVQKSINTSQTIADLERYNRSIKWKEYYAKNVDDTNDQNRNWLQLNETIQNWELAA